MLFNSPQPGREARNRILGDLRHKNFLEWKAAFDPNFERTHPEAAETIRSLKRRQVTVESQLQRIDMKLQTPGGQRHALQDIDDLIGTLAKPETVQNFGSSIVLCAKNVFDPRRITTLKHTYEEYDKACANGTCLSQHTVQEIMESNALEIPSVTDEETFWSDVKGHRYLYQESSLGCARVRVDLVEADRQALLDAQSLPMNTKERRMTDQLLDYLTGFSAMDKQQHFTNAVLPAVAAYGEKVNRGKSEISGALRAFGVIACILGGTLSALSKAHGTTMLYFAGAALLAKPDLFTATMNDRLSKELGFAKHPNGEIGFVYPGGDPEGNWHELMQGPYKDGFTGANGVELFRKMTESKARQITEKKLKDPSMPDYYEQLKREAGLNDNEIALLKKVELEKPYLLEFFKRSTIGVRSTAAKVMLASFVSKGLTATTATHALAVAKRQPPPPKPDMPNIGGFGTWTLGPHA